MSRTAPQQSTGVSYYSKANSLTLSIYSGNLNLRISKLFLLCLNHKPSPWDLTSKTFIFILVPLTSSSKDLPNREGTWGQSCSMKEINTSSLGLNEYDTMTCGATMTCQCKTLTSIHILMQNSDK